METKAISYVREQDVTSTVVNLVKEGYVINAVIPIQFGAGPFVYDIVVSRPAICNNIDHDDDEPQRMPGIVQPRYK